MNRPLLYIWLICSLFTACKEEEAGKKIVENHEQPEILELAEADEIEDYLESLEDSTQTSIYELPGIIKFYKDRGYEPVWTSLELRNDLYQQIENIEFEGLFYEDYHGEKIHGLLKNTSLKESNSPLEILLTSAFLRLSNDLGTGKLDPTKIYDIWGTPTNTVEPFELLNKIAEGQSSPGEILDSIKPDHVVYLGLKKALRQYREAGIKENSTTTIPSGKMIRPGEKDERIELVAHRLSELGYFKNNPDSVSNRYTKDIQTALESFQLDHGLQVDGLVGNTTIENLNLTTEDRYHQLLVNLERWRWYPRDLGDQYIIINIPNYELHLVKGKDTLRYHKTMVGTEARKTPVFSDKVEYIIYNPTWTIPPTILKNDIIPGTRNDLGYLQRKNIRVYNRNGNQVDPQEVNWHSSEARSYTFRQPAGPSNPLGLVKIIYPNKYMIYLHDTPSKKLFENNARAQSSGCVRVQDVLDLARDLLSDQKKYDDKKIGEILKSGRTTEIPVTKDVKVHHFYWTAYQKKDTTKFIDDIYDLDKKLWELLKP
ncbi:L,D-transpeptidase family protein [Christiangramia aquimixticola]|uniref:L,D-transpeptidase family protein n=1 Tax=Christiangramia aquimixticola TaxID=1697558 RepID=UPI003AA924B9